MMSIKSEVTSTEAVESAVISIEANCHAEVIESCQRYLSEADIAWIIEATPCKDPHVISATLLVAMVERFNNCNRMGDEDSLSREWNDMANCVFFDSFDHRLMVPMGPPILLDHLTGAPLIGPSRCPGDEDYFVRRKYPGSSPFPKKRLFSQLDD